MKRLTHRRLAVGLLLATAVRLLAAVGLLPHSASSSFATFTSISASGAKQDRHQQELICYPNRRKKKSNLIGLQTHPKVLDGILTAAANFISTAEIVECFH